MSIISSRRSIAVALCLAASWIPSIATAQTNTQTTEFAALAIENQKKSAFGWSYDKASLADAESEALAQCKKHAKGKACDVILAWSGPMCGSYYTHKKGQVHGWAVGRSRAIAEGNAMNEFYKRGPFEFADVTAFACNSTPRGATKVLINKPNTEPPPPLVLNSNGGYITGVAISADGKTGYSADRAGNIRAWNVASGKELRTYTGATLPSANLALSADGKRLAASHEGQFAVWDTATGRVVAQVKHNRWIDNITFSRDGKTIFGTGQPDFKVSPAWPVLVEIDASSARVLRETVFKLPSSHIYELHMVKNDSQFITVSDNPDVGLNLWDSASGNKVKLLAATATRSAALVNDGNTLMKKPLQSELAARPINSRQIRRENRLTWLKLKARLASGMPAAAGHSAPRGTTAGALRTWPSHVREKL
jgi:hypothetical protein